MRSRTAFFKPNEGNVMRKKGVWKHRTDGNKKGEAKMIGKGVGASFFFFPRLTSSPDIPHTPSSSSGSPELRSGSNHRRKT